MLAIRNMLLLQARKIKVADSRITPVLSNGVPSFTVTIPAGAHNVNILCKESDAASYTSVLLVRSSSTSSFEADTTYTFTDPYVEAGKTYCYRYAFSDGVTASASSYTKSITATGGAGLLGVTLSGTGAIDYNATTCGYVYERAHPTAVATSYPAASRAAGVLLCVPLPASRAVSVSATVALSGAGCPLLVPRSPPAATLPLALLLQNRLAAYRARRPQRKKARTLGGTSTVRANNNNAQMVTHGRAMRLRGGACTASGLFMPASACALVGK